MATSVPMIPPQPERAQYGIPDVALFQEFDRAGYSAKFREQAPAFDRARRVKGWFDSTQGGKAADELAAYDVVLLDKPTGWWMVKKILMTAGEAASVNLPGVIEYPAWVVQPTLAYVETGGARAPLNAETLATRAHAEMLRLELGGTVVLEARYERATHFYPADETRRVLEIRVGDQWHNAGLLLKQRYRGGVGATGRWQVDGGSIVWVPDLAVNTPPEPGQAPMAMPVRPLLPNEVLTAGFGNVPVIQRTDRRSEVGAGSAGLTGEQARKLDEIHAFTTEARRHGGF